MDDVLSLAWIVEIFLVGPESVSRVFKNRYAAKLELLVG